MRAVVQRVMSASVSVDGAVISSIGRGLLVLVGVSREDTEREMEYIVRKILNVRLFDDDQGRRWSKSVVDHRLPVLCVSQFTLYAVLKGNKPDFHQAMAGEQSQEFYERFLARLRRDHAPDLIKDGRFGAYMQVSLQNDGPVTITIDSVDMGQDNRAKKQNGGVRGQLTTAKSPCRDKSTAAAGPCSENKSTDDSLTILSANLSENVSVALPDSGLDVLSNTGSEDTGNSESIDSNDCKSSTT